MYTGTTHCFLQSRPKTGTDGLRISGTRNIRVATAVSTYSWRSRDKTRQYATPRHVFPPPQPAQEMYWSALWFAQRHAPGHLLWG